MALNSQPRVLHLATHGFSRERDARADAATKCRARRCEPRARR
ncbi:hypothetical protein GWE18_15015 [Bradyrhizobium sp. CSA112]|nr:hypothetical protein [Bradyrhizobium sp. CSA112]